ncbi:MAG TPA: hypothetical protein VE954_00620 [Oligoflexus sp.]|uniref:hypothetical protein n=1 Tax=Oligoflexus sp. TaxID=1971216 RepID=UPI002D3994A2|nr:hypothetical protein [Oligoflexus sp.]HYX31582.1 hypothetical protein [Oligoflexus sp.]
MAGFLKWTLLAGLALLNRDAYSKEMSGFRHFVGGALSVVPGFGLGHTVQSRWRESGWIFTAGDVVFFFGPRGITGSPPRRELLDMWDLGYGKCMTLSLCPLKANEVPKFIHQATRIEFSLMGLLCPSY